MSASMIDGTANQRMAALIRKSPPENADKFRLMMLYACADAACTPRAMADALGLSIGACEKYFAGTATPHSALFPVIADWVARTIDPQEN